MLKKRLKIFSFLIAAAIGVLVFAEAGICFFKNKTYSKSAAIQRTRTIEIKKHRGIFYDRNMIPLVENKSKVISPTENSSVTVTERYPVNSLAEHLIGYVNSDGDGVSGLEKCFNTTLKAPASVKMNVLTDAAGNIIQKSGVGVTDEAFEDCGIKLTLDCHVQKIAETVMDKYEISGAVVVLNSRNFDVLAMASRPAFDRNSVSDYLSSNSSQLVNRCICAYNAGSIFKIVTASAALESGTIKSETPFFCGGMYNINERNFACHKKDGHQNINFAEAFAASCNCVFYNAGITVGGASLLNAARMFGLGERVLCFDGLEEQKGNIPQKQNCGIFEAVNYSIGQGEILITPVQAANMTAIIANNGVANCVNLAEAIVSKNGAAKRNLRENDERRVISFETAVEIGKFMTLAVQSGTASDAKSDIVKISGKTGTAETGWYENGENLVHGWFCGYFPSDNPRYAAAVFVENGKSGSLSAVPVFKEIAEEIVKFYPVG